MQASQPSSRAGVWHYVTRTGSKGLEYAVFDGVDSEAIGVMRIEENARRIVETGNKTGHPDLAAMAADDQGVAWNARSADRK